LGTIIVIRTRQGEIKVEVPDSNPIILKDGEEIAGGKTGLKPAEPPMRKDSPQTGKAPDEGQAVARDKSTKPAAAHTTDSAKNPLPLAERINWNVKLLENHDCFTCERRVVEKHEIRWTLILNNDEAANIIKDNWDTPPYVRPFYTARFLDSEDVELARIRLLVNTPSVQRGDKVRMTLKLPGDEVLSQTSKVTIDWRKWP
jgi:hypothetical protein